MCVKAASMDANEAIVIVSIETLRNFPKIRIFYLGEKMRAFATLIEFVCVFWRHGANSATNWGRAALSLKR